jgi:hypothetical protein
MIMRSARSLNRAQANGAKRLSRSMAVSGLPSLVKEKTRSLPARRFE